MASGWNPSRDLQVILDNLRKAGVPIPKETTPRDVGNAIGGAVLNPLPVLAETAKNPTVLQMGKDELQRRYLLWLLGTAAALFVVLRL